MTDPETLSPSADPAPRWPRTVGSIGIVVGVLMFLDQVDDLLVPLFWTTEDWSRQVGPELAAFLVRTLPPRAWMVTTCLVKLALGAFLVLGSIRLRRRRRSGVILCRVWAGLAIAWLAVEMGWAAVWLARHAGEIPGIPAEGWQGFATCGMIVALAVLLAWPVFLLVWLAKPEVREQVAGWPP